MDFIKLLEMQGTLSWRFRVQKLPTGDAKSFQELAVFHPHMQDDAAAKVEAAFMSV
jgi:hypothetical protein